MNRGINCHLLGHCRQCDGPYKSAYVADGLCPACQADEDQLDVSERDGVAINRAIRPEPKRAHQGAGDGSL